ncbi:HlyD family type I secretion periplasmic adaptor subunit [Roseospirillum parvum]|uniref:Membrane fusion protein (MFP) family protein n=1 Tax=Roseospirillum parvum TaxID=83401 RepID=A0A1G7TZ67_9PROT|nr:HlyD family type I secretion periplasmic adaptor subunit [Roseospirillum parvum]SDG40394.1 HlyD family secretion protein/membrane fusion protein, adhesin transport system [Roseospirillum parvum]
MSTESDPPPTPADSGRALTPSQGAPGKTGLPTPSGPIRRGGRQVRYLAQHVLLEETGTSRLVRMALFLTSGVVLAFLVWAAVSRIQETAVAAGQVVPSGQIQVVQHLEGGIIRKLLVKEGDMVEAGEVLVRFDEASSGAEYEQMLARQASLRLRAERLRAVGTGREPDFAAVPGADQFPALVADQQAIYQTTIEAYQSRLAILERQLDQRRREIDLLKAQEESVKGQVALIKEQVDMRQELVDKGLVSRVTFLETKREYARLLGEVERLRGEQSTAFQRLAEVETRLAESTAALREDALNEMGTVTAELAQVTETLIKLSDRVRRLEARSPTEGMVQNLRFTNPGAVVPAGGVIADVVPFEGGLNVETRISTRDIGHVTAGQPVKVKFTAYDFSRYGSMDGTLERISASTFLDEMDQPYYQGTVVLDGRHLGPGPGENPILPGMTCQVDIMTGEKTLLEYLLKPIYVALDQAFHER